MPLHEPKIVIIEDDYLPEIRLLASELERYRITVAALHSHLIHLVGMATGRDLEIDNCELDAMRGVLKCEPIEVSIPNPINGVEQASGEDLVENMSLDLVEAIRRQRG